MECYLCNSLGTTREHVPARSFFPKGYRNNLITVKSCEKHNNETSLDDEYVRGVIVTCSENNSISFSHWRNDVKRSFLHNYRLFFKTFSQRHGNAFFHDRERIDRVITKIGHGLYYHEFNTKWLGNPRPFYDHMLTEDGKSDIDLNIPSLKDVKWEDVYKGDNPQVFKYLFHYATINKRDNYMLKMIFYEGFTAYMVPNL